MGTGTPNLYSFPDVTRDLAPSLRKWVLSAEKEALERHGVFRVAVSGGSLPKTLAAALLTEPDGSDAVSWAKWEIFYADERCVPLDHADSNHKLLREELLDKLPAGEGAAPPKVFPIDVAALEDPQEVADSYEQTMVSVFAARDSVRLPLFDAVLLGCGPDGHTASLFPDHALLRAADAWVLNLADSPKPPPRRITLSLPVILHAARIAFVATGAGKQEILKQIFETEPGRALPCGLVNEGAGEKVTWFCDAAATEGVASAKRITSVI